MYYRGFFTDRYRPPALGRVRPDLQAQALVDWETLPVEPGYVWREVGPVRGIRDPGHTRIDSGLVSTIAVGTNRDHLTIGTRASGVWGSDDEGQTWTSHGERLPSLQTVAVGRFDESGRPPLLMAGCGDTGEDDLRDPGLLGVFRSIDGGRSWSAIDAGAFGSIFRSHDVNRVIPIDRDRVLVATRVGLYFSKDGGRNFGNDADHRNGEPMLRGQLTDVLVDGNTVAAAVGGEPPDAEDPRPPELASQVATPAVAPGLYLSRLSAAGLAAFGSAARLTQVGPSSGLTPSKTVLGHSGRFWVMSASRLGALFQSFSLGGPPPSLHSVHLTRRDPVTAAGWGLLGQTEMEDMLPFQTTYCHATAIEPSTSATDFHAWWGAVRLFRARADVSSGSWTWTSTQRGTVTGANTGPVHADTHIIHVDDLTGPARRRILVGGDGGLFVTTDAGLTWTHRNNHGTGLLWSISLARASGSALRLLCGIQDNGTILGEGEPNDPSTWTWRRVLGGDGGLNAFWSEDPDVLPTDNPQRALVTQNGALRQVKPDPGPHWSEQAGFSSSGETSPVGFIYSETLAIGRSDSGDWDRIFFGNSHERNGRGILWRRFAAGSFSAIHPDPPYVVGPHDEWSAMITVIAHAPADPATERTGGSPEAWEHLWVGLANGEVWFSDDAGDTFHRQHVGGGELPIGAIAIDPNDSRRVAITYAGFSEGPTNGPTGHVFLTENLGANWRDISGRRGTDGFVPDLPVLTAVFTRTNPAALIIGTDIGALITRGPSFGARWTRLGVNLPKCPCSQLAVINDVRSAAAPALSAGLPPLAVATFGRGAFVLARPSVAEAVIEFDGGFGAMHVGETRRRTVTVHNVGGAPLSVGSPTLTAPFSLSGVPAGSIPARESRTFAAVAEPTSAGRFASDFTVAGVTLSVSCEAFADGPARLALRPRQINFGDVRDGQTAEHAIELQNFGQSDLEITAVRPIGSPSARFEFDPPISVALTLAPGEQRTLTLRFRASGVNTDHQGSWRLESNDPVTNTSHFAIRARAHVVAAADEGLSTGAKIAIGIVVGVVLIGVGYLIYECVTEEEEPPPGP